MQEARDTGRTWQETGYVASTAHRDMTVNLHHSQPCKEDRVVRLFTDGGCQERHYGARAGYGVFWDRGQMHGPLPGMLQTAQRAEVMAVLKGLEAVQQDLIVVSDSRYVVDTLGKTREEALKPGAIHRDLWEAIWIHRDRIRGVVWIKAHQAREQALSGGWREEDWQGNSYADQLATAGVNSQRKMQRR